MNQHYEPEFKKKIVRLHLEEGRSFKSLAAEYGVSHASISNWTNQFRNECQTNEEAKADYDYMKENLQLKKQLAELQKENDFLKKAAAFFAKEINQKWCTDFSYLFLTDGSKRYNCTIIDLHDRSVVASITDRNINSDLAKRTLEKAIDSQPGIDLSKLLVHSDQGSQYTSKEFTEFCEKLSITQSMSKAGYPYDNAPMERYFNTLKNNLIYQHYYHTEDELYAAIEEFAYVQYNHVRPHSYNNYKTPYEARYGIA